MSWLLKLHDTYEACKGREPPGAARLMPISHTTQQAQLEIVLDGQGRFRRARVIDKGFGTTLIPCTEESGGRAGSKPVPHPLCDKLQYLAGDYLRFGGEVTSGYAKKPQEPHDLYLEGLQGWAESRFGHPKLDAICRYVQQGSIVQDLVQFKVMPVDETGLLAKTWSGDAAQTPAVFKVLNAGQAPQDVFVRWQVEGDDTASGTWDDEALVAAWIAYYGTLQQQRGFCMVQGQEVPLAVQHPAKLRNAGDKAKLISANDHSGFTFRGRFVEASEALGVGFEVSQKAHNALRWLIARQGSRNGDQAVVAWAVSGAPVPDPMTDTDAVVFGTEGDGEAAAAVEDAGQPFALRLKRAMAGYLAHLDPHESVVVMALDSATPGRMSITYYRELLGSDFLQRIEGWHLRCAWPQNLGKDRKFVGAPAPLDIAEAAYGPRVDDKLKKATRERLLPCIVDGAPVPPDLVACAARRAMNRVGLEHWDWERSLGIACALYRGMRIERNYQMTLELECRSRDYLFGRLLAIAEHLESRALYLAGEGRETTAARLMQRFADRPASTWRSIELALSPYKTRLRNVRPSFLFVMEALLDQVVSLFGAGEFIRDAALSPEFLLGYHCQRQQLREGPTATDDNETTSTTP